MPDDEPELDEETRRILEERLATFDEDVKDAVDARDFLDELRRRLRLSRTTGNRRSTDLSH